jgi:hypothetical protein
MLATRSEPAVASESRAERDPGALRFANARAAVVIPARARRKRSVGFFAGIAPLRLELRAQPLGLEAPTHRACGPARGSAVATGAGRGIQSFGETSYRGLTIAQLGSLSTGDDPQRIAEPLPFVAATGALGSALAAAFKIRDFVGTLLTMPGDCDCPASSALV